MFPTILTTRTCSQQKSAEVTLAYTQTHTRMNVQTDASTDSFIQWSKYLPAIKASSKLINQQQLSCFAAVLVPAKERQQLLLPSLLFHCVCTRLLTMTSVTVTESQ